MLLRKKMVEFRIHANEMKRNFYQIAYSAYKPQRGTGTVCMSVFNLWILEKAFI